MIRWFWAFTCRCVLMLATATMGVTAAAVCIRSPIVPLAVVAAKAWRNGRRWQYGQPWQTSGSHGSARFCSERELIAHGMLGTKGLILGRLSSYQQPSRMRAVRTLLSPTVGSEEACSLFLGAFFGSRRASSRLIRVRSGVHLCTVAPTGRGKSVSVLLPNLLSYQGSCVVFDPAGELYRETAAHRERVFGHRIIRLDPYGVCGPGGDALNVLDFMGADDPDLLEQCRDLGDQLVVRKGTEPEPHWNESACNMISSFLFLICLCGTTKEDCNLQILRDILSSKQKFERAIWFMTQHEDGSTLRRLGGTASWHQDRELWSVMATVQQHTQWMDTPLLAACMNRSTFDPRVLRSGRATVYLILPHNKLKTLQSLIRLWIGSFMRLLTKPGKSEFPDVLFLLDESAMLGQMKTLEEATTQYRKFGIKLWFFWQSLDQMKECFGERANTILGNMDTQQYFGVNDYETADAISRRIGDQTIVTVSRNVTKGWSEPTHQVGEQRQPGSVSGSVSIQTSEQGRRLLKPEEIMAWPDSMGLVFHKNLPVIPTRQVYHYADGEFKRGGTGKQHGLGLAAGLLAVFTLVCSVVVSAAIFSVVPPPPGGWIPRRDRQRLEQWLDSKVELARRATGTFGADGLPWPFGVKAAEDASRRAAGPRLRSTSMPPRRQARQTRRPTTPFHQLIPIR